MSSLRTQAQLFGFDLSPLGRDLMSAWRGMLAWPMLAWLWPKLRVRLWLPTGGAVSSRGPDQAHQDNDKKLNLARFNAVLLPEHRLLRHTVELPRLQSPDQLAALTLQVASLSPFPAADLVWTHEVEPEPAVPGGTTRIHLALASRRLIASYLAQTYPDVDAAKAEIWLPSALKPVDLLLPGFGEGARLRMVRIWGWVSGLLALLALLVLVAMAITPTAQLYMRVEQAQASMVALKQKAVPVLKQRESLVHATDQLGNLAELTGKPLPPLYMLKLVTDALPDDTSVTSLQFQGQKVTLSGQTTDTTALMKHLSATAGLREVTAPTPATKPLGSPRELFTIEFTLDPVQPKPAASQPATSQAAASQPTPSQAAASQAGPSQLKTSQPAASQPATSQPAASLAAPTQLKTSQPAASQPTASQSAK